MTPTFDRLCVLLVKSHKLPPERLTSDAPLESLGIDSLGIVELLWNVEDAFQITLPPEQPDLRTLGDVARYVDELVAGQGIAPAPAASASSVLPAVPGLRAS